MEETRFLLKNLVSKEGKNRLMKKANPVRYLIVTLFLAVFFVQAVSSISQKSVVYDEPMQLARGYTYWRTGELALTAGHPPLIDQLATLPLLPMDLRVPDSSLHYTTYNDQFLYHNRQDADKIIFWSRIPVVLLALALGLFTFKWAEELYGLGGGLMALFLFTFDPNLLAEARLVVTNVPVACFIFITVYFFWRLLRRPTTGNLLLSGLFFGLAQATKLSAIVLGPILALLALGQILAGRELRLPFGQSQSYRKGFLGECYVLLVMLFLIGIIGFAVVFVVYRGEIGPIADLGPGMRNYLDRLVPQNNPALASAVRFFLEKVPVPAPKYFYGFIETRYAFSEFSSVFFMNRGMEESWWDFFPVVFLIKSPVAKLLLLLGAVALSLYKREGFWDRDIFLIAPALTYFLIVMITWFPTGYHHLLPVLPFLFVFIGKLAPWAFQGRRRLVAGLPILLLGGWYFVSSVSVYPHYLAYFNELVGGPDNGYKYLVECNLDWGQDLKGLKAYMDENDLEEIWLGYFGTANPDYYGINYRCLPSRGLLSHERCRYPDRSSYERGAGIFAVSATLLQGRYLKDTHTFDWLKEYEPVAKIGYSIFIYNLLPAQAEEVRIGDNLIFNGYSVVGESADGGLLLDLYWRSRHAEAEDDRVYLKLLNGVYQVWGQQDGPGIFSGSEWLRGRMVRNRREIEVWPGTPPGFYQIAIDIHDPHNDRWLEPADRDELLLGPVENPRREPPPIDSLDIERWSGVNLGDRVRLLGYNRGSGFRPGGNLHLTLFWEAVAEMDEDYTVFVHLVDEEGRIWGQKDSQPVSGFYPTTNWKQGEIVRDQYDIAIPAETPSGWYRLALGMYLAQTGERLKVFSDDLSATDRILSEAIKVETETYEEW